MSLDDFTNDGTTLGIPFITLNVYLQYPRHVRWTIYLSAALVMREAIEAYQEAHLRNGIALSF